MFSKKKTFFYVFYVTLISIFNILFNDLFLKGFTIKNIQSLTNLSNNIIYLFYTYLIIISILGFIYSINNYFFKKDFYIIIFISMIIQIAFKLYYDTLNINFISISVLYFTIIILYINYITLFKKENHISSYFNTLFCLLFTTLLLVGFAMSINQFDNDSSAKELQNVILSNNFIILDILNNHSNEILYNHINKSYNFGFENGYMLSCFDNMIINCSYKNNLSQNKNFLSSYFSKDLILFNKEQYTIKLKEEINKNISIDFLTLIYLLYLTITSLIFTFIVSFIMPIFRFIISYIIKFFSWLTDPLGIDKYKN